MHEENKYDQYYEGRGGGEIIELKCCVGSICVTVKFET